MSRKHRSVSVASSTRNSALRIPENSWRTVELVRQPDQKMEKSHDFFKQTKITTCSYIKKEGNDFKAMPYYVRPKQQYSEFMNKSMYTSSITGDAYRRHPYCHSAMRQKPLQVYDPNAKRSRLAPPEYRFSYVNKSEIEIGKRNESHKKHYTTTNSNHIGNFGMTTPCSHPLIMAQRAKWNHHLKEL